MPARDQFYNTTELASFVDIGSRLVATVLVCGTLHSRLNCLAVLLDYLEQLFLVTADSVRRSPGGCTYFRSWEKTTREVD